MRRVSSNVGLGADCSRVATCGEGVSGRHSHGSAHHPQHHAQSLQVHFSHCTCPYLLVVDPDQVEDKAAVHQGQQIAEEEG